MKFFHFWLLFFALLPAASGQPPPAAPSAPPQPRRDENAGKPRVVFELLPKSLQKNPLLDMTVITEMTEEGKKLPAVSPESPAYYVTHCAGFRQLGDAPGNEKTLGAGDMEKLLVEALNANGYRRASPPDHPPSLLIIYVWGSHNLVDHTIYDDKADDPNSPVAVAYNLLERAALVGGEKFAKQMLEKLEESSALETANRSQPAFIDVEGNVVVAPIAPALGPEHLAFTNSMNQFRLSDRKIEFLMDQAANELYYVVASAYDYPSFARKERKLLWRTRMTVNSSGVSQVQTLPTLVENAAPFFGKDMAEPEILFKRVREGQVTIGPLKVEEFPAAETRPGVGDNAAPKPDGVAGPKAP